MSAIGSFLLVASARREALPLHQPLCSKRGIGGWRIDFSDAEKCDGAREGLKKRAGSADEARGEAHDLSDQT